MENCSNGINHGIKQVAVRQTGPSTAYDEYPGGESSGSKKRPFFALIFGNSRTGAIESNGRRRFLEGDLEFF